MQDAPEMDLDAIQKMLNPVGSDGEFKLGRGKRKLSAFLDPNAETQVAQCLAQEESHGTPIPAADSRNSHLLTPSPRRNVRPQNLTPSRYVGSSPRKSHHDFKGWKLHIATEKSVGQGAQGVVVVGNLTHTESGESFKVAIKFQEVNQKASIPQEHACRQKFESDEVVKTHGYFVADGRYYLILDRAEGSAEICLRSFQNLASFVPDAGHRKAFLAHVFLQIAEGIASMNQNGVLHLDLKWKNILMKNGRLMLCDLGLSSARIDSLRGPIGNLASMSPELLAKGTTLSASNDTSKADIWGIGAMLFNVLFGRNYFSEIETSAYMLLTVPGKNQAVATYLQTRHAAAMETLSKSIDVTDPQAELKRISLRCLSIEPQARPAAAQVREQLSKIIESVFASPAEAKARYRMIWAEIERQIAQTGR